MGEFGAEVAERQFTRLLREGQLVTPDVARLGILGQALDLVGVRRDVGPDPGDDEAGHNQCPLRELLGESRCSERP